MLNFYKAGLQCTRGTTENAATHSKSCGKRKVLRLEDRLLAGYKEIFLSLDATFLLKEAVKYEDTYT